MTNRALFQFQPALVCLVAFALLAPTSTVQAQSTELLAQLANISLPSGARTDPLRPYLVEVRIDFQNVSTSPFGEPFSSTQKINAFYKQYALQDNGNATAIMVKQRLISLEPKDGSVVKYVFYFRRDIVSRIITDFKTTGSIPGGFFAVQRILFMDYHTQQPAPLSTLASCHIMGYSKNPYDGQMPVMWCSIDWVIGCVIALAILIALEVSGLLLCKDIGSQVIVDGDEDGGGKADTEPVVAGSVVAAATMKRNGVPRSSEEDGNSPYLHANNNHHGAGSATMPSPAAMSSASVGYPQLPPPPLEGDTTDEEAVSPPYTFGHAHITPV